MIIKSPYMSALWSLSHRTWVPYDHWVIIHECTMIVKSSHMSAIWSLHHHTWVHYDHPANSLFHHLHEVNSGLCMFILYYFCLKVNSCKNELYRKMHIICNLSTGIITYPLMNFVCYLRMIGGRTHNRVRANI